MIDQGSYLMGVITGAGCVVIFACIAASLLLRELRRVRGRLQGIILKAKEIDHRWARRPLTGNDWGDMFIEISPYEEA